MFESETVTIAPESAASLAAEVAYRDAEAAWFKATKVANRTHAAWVKANTNRAANAEALRVKALDAKVAADLAGAAYGAARRARG